MRVKIKKSKKKEKNVSIKYSIFGILILLVGLFTLIFAIQQKQQQLSKAAPSADQQKDKTNLSFTGSQYSSEYHLYAAGLDWTKSVGMILYTDGSGEYGLKNPTSDYLLGGSTGLIAVAKKHNMILVTPFSPNKDCSDGDGSCWYMGDSEGYVKWAEELVTQIQTQYPIDKSRIAVGGYSSGAQFSTEFWVPSGAAQRTMTDGVIVGISYGGAPQMNEVSYTSAFKSNVHMAWNVGDQDPSYTGDGDYGVQGGYDYFTSAGFDTSLEVIPGKDHERDGDFGPVMDALITKYVPPATAAGPTGTDNPNTSPTGETSPTSVVPTYYCGGSSSCIPSPSIFDTDPYVTETPNVNPSETIEPTETSPDNEQLDPEVSTSPDDENDYGNGNGSRDKDGNGDGNRGRRSGGIFEFFFAFLELILRFFESLFQR